MRIWTTADRPPAEQYSYWREVVCEAFTALDPVAQARSGFDSLVVQRQIGELAVCDTRSKAQSVIRSVHEIRRNPTPYYFINLHLSGTCLIRQERREVLMRPGDFYIVDTTEPYEQGYGDFHVISLRLPRQRLAPWLAAPRESTAVRLSCGDGGLGGIAGAYIKSLLGGADGQPPAAQAAIVSSLVELLAAALGGTVEAREQGRAAVRRGLRQAILRYVQDHLADPALSVAAVAQAFRISPRYLHQLFEEHERSFAQTVLEQRLRRCAEELAGGARPVAEIAGRWGFGDLSHFCRTFRRRYGTSAREFRLAAGRPH